MTEKNYLTVTALTKYIKYKFDQDAHLKHVLLKGEISNFKHHSRGHFYFTLKDDKAQISAIMFASNSKKVLFRPEDGMSVLVEGYISVYETSGNYQIYVSKMDEDGLGNLYVAYEQLKEKLHKEGLFDPKHKKSIPRFPGTIAVLTSPTGAAVRDVIHIVNRRYPLARIIVYPTLVQGEYAKDSIITQIQKANSDGNIDVIILGRGGGSIEDLWPFNEEAVAYAIFASTVPIISSVGHETDFTISDFVADLRAPTPSGGAELAVPNQVELDSYLAQLQEQLKRSLSRTLETKKERLLRSENHPIMRDPLRLLEHKQRRVDHVSDSLRLLHPGERIKQGKKDILSLTRRLHDYMKQVVYKKQSKFDMTINKLELVNPLSIMKKGYSVTRKNGVILHSISSVDKGDTIDVSLVDGTVQATINSIRKDEHNE